MIVSVLGSTGMAGHVISAYLEEQGHLVYKTSRSEKNTDYSAAIDVTNFNLLGSWLDTIRPDAVVNCAGLLQKASESRPDLAILMNSYLPHWLERKFINSETRIIHLSTDCVFSGSRGAYREDDFQDGSTFYDRSKALGELKNNKDLTFRMSIVGPDVDPKGTGLFNWFMTQHGEINGFKKTFWSGISTIELARAINCALETKLSGLYHLVPDSKIDKCSLLEIFRKTFDVDIRIKPVDGLIVDKSLINTRKDFDFHVQDYSHQVADMKAWIDSHRWMYPHYKY